MMTMWFSSPTRQRWAPVCAAVQTARAYFSRNVDQSVRMRILQFTAGPCLALRCGLAGVQPKQNPQSALS